MATHTGRIGTEDAIPNTGSTESKIAVMPTALLVTDAGWVTNDVRSALAVDHWEIIELSDPRLSGEKAKETLPDAVIIDMQVQSMGGMAIVRAIRASFQESPPPRTVLLLDRSADRFLARRAMADAAVLKPIVASELKDALGPVPASPVS